MPSTKQLADAIRVLSMDAVQAANSGHPGMPMGMADIAEVLWNDFLVHNPKETNWLNRDRFILSNGHGSMLHYALLHLSGYDISLEDLKQFRQLHSKTPGHPEVGDTPGVETTTGPLGQGLANGVGMAIAQSHLAAQFNRDKLPIIDNFTYIFAGDGCLMEGVSHEVCSLAGTLKLGKLIVFWDDNGISIDGEVKEWYSEEVPERFKAYHWQVIAVDGHDRQAIAKAIQEAQLNTEKPTLIACKTIIGFGSPDVAGTAKAHGAPLGEAGIQAARKQLGWEHASFDIPEAIYQAWNHCEQGEQDYQRWQAMFETYQTEYPELAQELLRRSDGDLPENWTELTQTFVQQTQDEAANMATRKASQACLHAYAPHLPELMGGSADLTGSNLTMSNDSKPFAATNPDGNYIYYGVREFGMSAIMNGLALYGGFIPYGGTFLTFLDYARNAVRMSALMQQRVIYVYTHDSLGLGEDGPTHQPIEHLSMLRATPNCNLWRPCDTTETAVAWQMGIEHQGGPTCLALSRQSLPHQARDTRQIEEIKKGAYILHEPKETVEAIIIATGSEVALAMKTAEHFAQTGQGIRVVSMPSMDVFAQQEASYQEQVLPANITKRVAIEAGATQSWYQYVGLKGRVVGVDSFGVSAPAADAFKEKGITTEHLIESVNALL